MPSYANNPFVAVPLLIKGVPTYLWGTYNFHQANTRMLISNSALTGNVATLTVQIVEGEIPIVGALVSVQQTAGGAGAFNINRQPLTAVAINAATGQGTISFAVTHANVAGAADAGTAIAEVPEVGETAANGASMAVCVQPPPGVDQFTVPVAVTFPALPTAATVTLQRAIHNIDSEFTSFPAAAATVAAGAQTAGPVTEYTLERGYFYRFLTSGVTGAGTVVAKIG